MREFGFDAERGVGNCTEAFFGDEFARDTTYAVGFVLDAYECGFETLDELLLASGHVGEFFFGLGHRAFFKHFIGRHGVVHTIAIFARQGVHNLLILSLGEFDFGIDELLELFKLFVRVAVFFRHDK